MKATIPAVNLAKVGTQQIDIGQLSAGPMTVGTFALEAVHLDLSTGGAKFTNLQVSVGLAMSIDWRVEVHIGPFGPWHWDGTIDLGSKSASVSLGDVTLPGLETFAMDLGSLTVNNLQAIVAPLIDIHLGELIAEQVQLHDLLAPVPDFHLLGIGLGKFAVDGLVLPGATAGSATIGRIAGQAFPLGSVSLGGIEIPEAAATDISSGAIDVSGTSNPFIYEADAGVLKLTLRVIPSASTKADSLSLSNVKTSGSIGSIALQDVVLPYEILNLSLGQLGIESIEVPTLEVS